MLYIAVARSVGSGIYPLNVPLGGSQYFQSRTGSFADV